MSDLRRDVGQLIWVGFEGTSAPDGLKRMIAAGDVGGVIVFKRNLRFTREVVTYAGAAPDAGGNPSLVEQAMSGRVCGERLPEAAVTREVIDLDAVKKLNQSLKDAVGSGGDPLLVSVDQEGGRVQRIRAPATVWPPMMKLDDIEDIAAGLLAEEVGLAMGRELRAVGFDVDFAPVLDIHTNDANPIIGDRAFSTTADRVITRALAFARGLERAGVIGCGKHFPGHGDTSTDSHLELPKLDHDMARLRKVELEPFRRAATEKVPMLMTAHVVFSALDPKVPATLSRKVITDLLRKDLGYGGVVVSDDLDMKAISANYGAGDAAVRAIDAGCDVLLCCRDSSTQKSAREALIRKAEGSATFRTRVAEAAGRTRALKKAHAARLATGKLPAPVIGGEDHRRLADRMAGL